MHPRYRRLLIPGLLVVLVAVVVVSALVNGARGRTGAPPVHGSQALDAGRGNSVQRLGVITDSRIPESSGLALSTRDPRLAYTVNDSGNTPAVFTVDIATGEVVGTTVLTGYRIDDLEALAVDGDDLWVADIGDNDSERTDASLYQLAQPARGELEVQPVRYPLRYAAGPTDAEALLVDPASGQLSIVGKGLLGGEVYRLPSDLVADHVNIARALPGVTVPLLVTDGAYFPDGSRVVLRNYLRAYAYDPSTWQRTWSTALPRQRQGESLAVEPDAKSILIGTEGLPSPILRVGLGDEAGSRQRQRLFPVGGIIDAAAD